MLQMRRRWRSQAPVRGGARRNNRQAKAGTHRKATGLSSLPINTSKATCKAARVDSTRGSSTFRRFILPRTRAVIPIPFLPRCVVSCLLSFSRFLHSCVFLSSPPPPYQPLYTFSLGSRFLFPYVSKPTIFCTDFVFHRIPKFFILVFLDILYDANVSNDRRTLDFTSNY